MKLRMNIVAHVCVAMFLFSLVPVNAQDITNWTWSENLQAGDYFRWEVNMTWDGAPITEINGNDGPPFVDGSNLELWIYNSPYGYHFEETTTATALSQYFDLKIDGNTNNDPEILPALMFPNTLFLSDGSEVNYFEYMYTNGTPWIFFDEDGWNVTEFIIQEGQQHVGAWKEYPDENRTVSQWWNHNIELGTLHWLNIQESYTNGSIMEASIGIMEQQTSHDGGDNDVPEGAHWSNLLDTGDYFEWEVINFVINGVTNTVPTTTGDDFVPAVGSVVRIDIVGEPEDFDLTDENVDPNSFFEFSMDGTTYDLTEVFKGPGDFAQFIYPKDIKFENGTEVDFFEFIVANQDTIFKEDSEVTASISGNVFTIEVIETRTDDNNRVITQSLEFNADNGVMRSMHRSEAYPGAPAFLELHVNLITEHYADGDESSGGPVPLDAPSIVWILPSFAILPILRKKH